MSDRAVRGAIGVVSVVVIAVVAYLLLGHVGQTGVSPAVAALPLVNACLNATAAALLSLGFLFIRRKRVGAHRVCMISALVVSLLFLGSYVTYHTLAGSRPFHGRGWLRAVYFPILISHVFLAAAIVPLVLATVSRALRGHFARHRRLARWTLPLWLYVSVTGVVVYWMLYRL